jgi:hypothetical protein
MVFASMGWLMAPIGHPRLRAANYVSETLPEGVAMGWLMAPIGHPRLRAANYVSETLPEGVAMGWLMGLEPTTLGTTIRCSTN